MTRVWIVIEYLLAGVMLLGGVNTFFQPVAGDPSSVFALIFNSHLAYYFSGVSFFVLGLILLYGLIRHKPNVRSRSLLVIYCFMVFATLVDMLTTGLWPVLWLDSVIIGIFAAISHGRINVEGKPEVKRLFRKRDDRYNLTVGV